MKREREREREKKKEISYSQPSKDYIDIHQTDEMI
jgi:hypothetical protein